GVPSYYNPTGIDTHARPSGQHAEVERLEYRECIVRPVDEQHGLPRLHLFAVVQRVYDELVPPLGAQFENRDRLIDAAQKGVRFAEHLHRDSGAVPGTAQQIARAHEVFVGVIAFAHLVDGKMENGWIEPLLARSCHQRGPGQANVAASVSPLGSGSGRATLLSLPRSP